MIEVGASGAGQRSAAENEAGWSFQSEDVQCTAGPEATKSNQAGPFEHEDDGADQDSQTGHRRGSKRGTAGGAAHPHHRERDTGDYRQND